MFVLAGLLKNGNTVKTGLKIAPRASTTVLLDSNAEYVTPMAGFRMRRGFVSRRCMIDRFWLSTIHAQIVTTTAI